MFIISKFCLSCGKENDQKASFCKNCGIELPENYKNPIKDQYINILGFVGATLGFIGSIFIYSNMYSTYYFMMSSLFMPLGIIAIIPFILGIYYMNKNDKNGILALAIAGILSLASLNISQIFALLGAFGVSYTNKDNKIGGIIAVIFGILLIPQLFYYYNPLEIFKIIGSIILIISGILAILNVEILAIKYYKN